MNLFLLAGIILVACAVACALLFGVHRLARRDVLLKDTTRGAGVYAVVGTSFAVLLAFVVLIAFQSFTDGREGAEAEADAVIELSRDVEFYPQAQAEELQSDLACYGRAVIAHDWPAMREGHRSPIADGWALEIQRHFVNDLTVVTPKQQWAFGDMLDLSDARVGARRQRLTQARSIVTAPVWFILGLGALLNIVFILVFIDRRSESFAVQAFLIASVTAIVISGLLLIWFLDNPYEDQTGSIQPDEMENAVSLIVEQNPGVKPHCTESGDPL